MNTDERSSPPWQDLIAGSITTAEALSAFLPVDVSAVKEVIRQYPMRINPYYLGMITAANDPMGRQAIPDAREIAATPYAEDPLAEEYLSPVPLIIRRYPDRVLFMVSNQCAMFCRFCLRKRTVGRGFQVTDADIAAGLAYLKQNRQIREVILSGGDPLLLEDDRIESILSRLEKLST